MAVQPQSSVETRASRVKATVDFITGAGIAIPHPDEVIEYLLRHADMLDLVRTVCQAARSEFGSDVQLSLELYRDPENSDAYLSLYARSVAPTNAILVKADQLSERFNAALAHCSGWIVVTTDFQPPRS